LMQGLPHFEKIQPAHKADRHVVDHAWLSLLTITRTILCELHQESFKELYCINEIV
jgi:hypothetical protein